MRPATRVTDDSAVFWDAAREGRLVAQSCLQCQALRHPPRPMCPRCGALAHAAVDLSGNASLYSYAVLHHPQHPAFDYPVLAALVDLDEGVRMVSSLVDVQPQDIHIGMRLEVAYEATSDGGAVPVFRPAGGSR